MIISVTKPKGKPAHMLAAMGVEIVPVEEDEDNVDRYILSKRVAIERRTGSGFLRGIVDKTLFTSAIYLREHFEVPILIVEGETSDAHRAFDPQAVRGALSSMMLVYGLSVLSTPNLEETVALIALMVRHEQAGVPEISLVPKRRAADITDMQRRVIEMLPGCGMVAARDLLQRFGSVRRIADASEAEFCDVRGIGKAKATEIYQVLNAEYESVDTEKDLEDVIEAAPELLFERPVNLLARQHHIYSAADRRHIIDMVFRDGDQNELILVELKRGRLATEHEDQLWRYLEHAGESELLRAHMERGDSIRGVLATAAPCAYAPRDPARVSVRIVDRSQAIEVLKRLRDQRLHCPAR